MHTYCVVAKRVEMLHETNSVVFHFLICTPTPTLCLQLPDEYGKRERKDCLIFAVPSMSSLSVFMVGYYEEIT